MKIGTRISNMNFKRERYIWVHNTETEYHPENTGFFLSDLDTFKLEDLISEKIRNKEIQQTRKTLC